MREHPCLPLKANGQHLSKEELALGIHLPLYSCPWKGCNYASSNRELFLHHVAGGVSDMAHREMINSICGQDITWMSRLDYVYNAAALAERERWPRLGLSNTRRSLNLLCSRFNDATIKCLSCFVCGQLRTTCQGYAAIDLNKPITDETKVSTEIEMVSAVWFMDLENSCPGTMMNNCSYDLWQARYVHQKRSTTKVNPLETIEPQGVFSLTRL